MVYGEGLYGAGLYGEADGEVVVVSPSLFIRGRLGCGDYAVYLVPRGGRGLISEVPWTQVQWGRLLDDTSQVTIVGEVGACGAAFALMRSWRQEIAVYRNGTLIWVGPVYQVNGDPDSPQVTARDLSAWWDRRFVHEAHDYLQVAADTGTGVDLATIFKEISDDAMLPDNTPGLYAETTPTGVEGMTQVFPDQRQKAGSILRDLSQSGIDWTVVGRRVLAGGIVVPTEGPVVLLTDDDLQTTPLVIDDGSVKANREVIQGQGANDSGYPIEGVAEDEQAQYEDGLLEDAENLSSIFDEAEAVSSAKGKLELNKDPLAVQNIVLDETAPVQVNQLVPGAVVELDLRETIRPVSGRFRLQAVNGQVDSSTDTISIDCQPLGKTG